ncbi:hypothetical protein Tco_0370557 [Tanacetum coccineum]
MKGPGYSDRLFEMRKKQLVAERAEAIRNNPPTKTQFRNLMMTYLKNMGGYKHSQLKGKSYQEIQGLYERQQKRIQDFTPMDSEKEDQKPSKRLERVRGSYATQKSPKKLKVMKSAKDVTEEEATEYEKEKKKIRLSLKIISNDDSEVDYEPLSRKFPIVNWEYQLQGKMEAKDMLVRNGFIDHPLEGHDLLLWGDLRMIFNPDKKDELWMNQLDWKLLRWKLYESYRVYTLFIDGTHMEINMLVEKKYPLIKELLEKMLNLQLEVEEEKDMEFEYAQSNTTAKLPILKLENGNSWVSVPQIAQENGTSVTKMSVPVTAEEKNNKKNDVKARSFLPPEWNTHVVVWMNKAEIETMSIDDLYNNFKIVEQSVKKSVGASSGAQNLAFMTAPSTSSTNDVNTAKPAYEVSTVSPNVNTASPQVSTASFSDNVVYAFMVENPNGSNLLQQDLEQIHEDDLEAMDLKWQLSLLSMRAKRWDTLPGSVEHQGTKRVSSEIKTTLGNNEDTSLKAMLAIDGVGFDWSDMAEEQVQINMALMAFSDSELNQTKFTAATYKRGLVIIEEQLITYRNNEVLFSEEVAVLKREVACKDYEINVLKNKLLGSQITDKSKKGLGYSDVPPPHPLIYNQPKKLDLSYSGLDEFKDPEFKSYGSEDSKQESNIVCDKKLDDSKENSDDSLVKEQVSEDTSSFVESSLNVDKETVFLVDKKIEFVKPKNHEKPVKRSVRYAEMYRSQSPRGNQRNWNGQKSNQLGSDFVMYNKACFVCGSFDHIQAHCKYHQRERMVYGNNYNRVHYNYTTNRFHSNAQRNMVPRAVLMKTSLKPFNITRTVNTAHPKSIVLVLNQCHIFQN